LLHPWGDPRVSGFTNALSQVHALSERAPGFVWRLEVGRNRRPGNDADAVFGADPHLAITMSVWTSVDALRDYVRNTLHGAFVKRRAEWFSPASGPAYALWSVRDGPRPTLAEGKARLDDLAAHGPTARAFDFTSAAEILADEFLADGAASDRP
jgi:hypothetical protein